ncbi:diacylglycerol/lipid kinase family protein [Mucilaginibacter myungsuensis]|uniref:DAGKc domain-containing protein n=1 Tax=Mucilaginibacter myungsuensis TaxID=649104 RepID=A0A929KXL8_9SPHI|nr:diacylglycerol kinase family protein [Mucilaginibacter myungsuensis]MBE9660779.1 hypothetical protein [Mucilaginibacter myungsuensis]MDN3600824.1 diacylglycerol kinase family protein [Mucilaginibacter myungsuensis]
MSNLPTVTLLHNPSAGDEDHAGEHLTAKINAAGYDCRYLSTKEKGWKKFDAGSALIVVAGGDGTIKKAVKALLKRDLRIDIGLLPSGTANNIARSLGLTKDQEQNISGWKKQQVKQVDIGTISGLHDKDFFLESVGCGILPALMKEMKHADKKLSDEPAKRLEAARKIFVDLTHNYKPKSCKLIIDGKDHSGDYILIEILNMPYVGPNLRLSPTADAGDGNFDIVLVSADAREILANLLDGEASVPTLTDAYQVIRGRQIALEWPNNDVHFDDGRVEAKKQLIKIGIRDKQFQFLI